MNFPARSRHTAASRDHTKLPGRGLLALVLGLVGSLALFVPSALAVEGHVYSKTLGAGELALGPQSSLALNQTTGELYVADTGNSRVAKYTTAGAPDGTLVSLPTPTFIAVDSSSGGSQGDVYVVNSNRTQISKFDSAGAPVASWGTAGVLGGLGSIAGIATDPEGDLWVASAEANQMREFDPSGAQKSQWGDPLRGPFSPLGIAVDSDQNSYYAGGCCVFSNTAAGVFRGAIRGPAGDINTIAVSALDDELYTGSREQGCRTIERYDVEGEGAFETEELLEEFPNIPYLATCQTSYEIEAEAPEVSGIAVREQSAEVFVATAGVIKDYVETDITPPTVAIDAPTAITMNGAHVIAHVNPAAPTGNPPSYGVTWKFTCAPASCTAAAGEIAADDEDHLVESVLEGLQPGTKYTATITARNSLNAATASVQFKTLAAAPAVLAQSVSNVMPEQADLDAMINPRGAATTYHFEYVPEAAFLAEGFESAETRSTSESGPIDEEAKPHEVSAQAIGLIPGAPYRFRVVATNSVGTTSGPPSEVRTQLPPFVAETNCPNQLFRIGFGSRLPDCRAYEQATPTDKVGLGVEGFLDYFAAASDGSGATFLSTAGTGMPAGGGGHQEYADMLSSRDGDAWSLQRLLPPEASGQRANFLGASTTLRYALVEGCLRGEGPGTGCVLFLQDTVNHTFTQIVDYGLNHIGAPEYDQTGTYAYDGISSDGSRVFFETQAQITPDATPGKVNLYMWDRASSEVTLVGILPGATPKAPPGGSFGGAYKWTEGQGATSSGGALAGLYVEAIHAISEAGDRAYFTAGQTGQLYLRRNLSGPNPSTLQVSAPLAGVADPNGTKPAAFQEATPDGTRAFFLSSQKLTPDATTGPSDEGADLYRYDAATKTLVDVSVDTTDSAGAQVRGLLGVSNDGTAGFFVARGVLASGATAGANNIYRFQGNSDGSYSYSFVGTTDLQRNWSASSTGPPAAQALTELYKSSRVSPDARTLVYSSTSSTAEGCSSGGGSSNAHCKELYMYSVDRGGPFCVSCNPTGEKSFGDATLSTVSLDASFPPRGFVEQRLTRNLSPDGMRLVFQSPDPLVAGDTNASSGCTYPNFPDYGTRLPDCTDVYEWEAVGAPEGSCDVAEVNGGCLYLLSSGKSKNPSNFIDMSTDGRDVFIATTDQLVPADGDELFDLYDVGINRGVAAQHLAESPPCNSAEACHGPGGEAPSDPSPGTAAFQGPGNSAGSKNKRKPCRKEKHKKCDKTHKGRHGTGRGKHGKKHGHPGQSHRRGSIETGDGQ